MVWILLLILAGVPPAQAERSSADAHQVIREALEVVGRLQAMDNSRTYTLPARGGLRTGVPDDFLRTRTPQEILDSGLATGCGDFAAAFYYLVESQGLQALYIDGTEMSWRNLLTHDAGHTGVAVRDDSTGRWILVDPTFQVIVSEDWDIHSKIYAGPGGRQWIGYVGALEDYPVRDHPGLMDFEKRTLASVPKSVLESELMRFEFAVDDSLRAPEGGYVNPNVARFLTLPDQLQKQFGLNATRPVRITLADGGDDRKDRCRIEKDAGRCSISRNSRMDLSLFLHIQGCLLEGCFHADQVP